jgi:serine/threonine-protein kinase
MGTAQYLSPEQAQGHAVSPGSDLYSIGVILYEMLTGRVPFDAEAAVTIAIKHVSEVPALPSAFNPNIPSDLERIVMWSLNKGAAERPLDAGQFIDALEQVRAMIVSGTGGQRTASFAALAYGAGTATAVSDTTPPGTGSFIAAPWGPPAEPPEQQRRRKRWPWIVALLVLLLAGGGVAAYLLTRPTKKIVPAVVGENLQDASANVQNAGFNPDILQVTNSKKAGTVIHQDPQPGTKANEGSSVTLTVSTGPGSTTVPSVSGESQKQAEKTIKQALLKIDRTNTETSDTVPAGEATRTDPGAGVSLPVNSKVALFISEGKPQVTVPNVQGDTQATAETTLKNDGFTVSTSTEVSSSATPGTVISQTPAGDTSVDPGSNVSIVIAEAPPTVNVPFVQGDKASAASNTLTSAGLKVTQRTQTVTDQAKDGVVISQSPNAGSSVTKGSTVTIVVGKFQQPTTTTTKTTTTPTTTTSRTTTTTRT